MNSIQRKNIVRALIVGLNVLPNDNPAFVQDDNTYADGDACCITGLYFPLEMSEKLTYSNYGPIWMGLWLDDEVVLSEEHGNTLFPRWLAEVLNGEESIKIEEKDIYDD